jgi:hypothetical protein
VLTKDKDGSLRATKSFHSDLLREMGFFRLL